MKSIIIAVSLLIFLLACEKSENQTHDFNKKIFLLDTPDKIDLIEYNLICASFDSIVLQQATNYFILPFSTMRQEIHDLDSIAYKNYVDNNDMSYNLDSTEFAETAIKLISIAERDYLIDNPDFGYTWDEFYKKYPDSGGLFTLSRAGFNSDSTCAILSYGFSKPFYGMDIINYYKLVDKKWILTGKIGIHTQ